MDDTSVKVAVRVRPQSAREVLDMCQICSHVVPGESQIVLGKDKYFSFDFVFNLSTVQNVIYEACCAELIEGTFEGYNATILAYGQTGSGKTYTMGTGFDLNMLQDEVGIIPRAVKHLFDGIEERHNEAIANDLNPPEFKVNAQFIELYNEEVNDLLDSTRDPTEKGRKSLIRIHEDANGNIYTVGATAKPVSSYEDTLECLKIGALLRTTASTQMNVQSSRSHAIFTLHIRQRRTAKTKSIENCNGVMETMTEDVEMLSSKFHFVDLAGSERLKRTGATGDRAKEGISINCGLLALGNVISALGDKMKRGSHVPYRDSKLTRFLQDSLGGNSRTLMIACISPSDRDFIETLNSLKYANRARNIKNKVSINQDKTSKQMSALRTEVQALQCELMEYKSGRKTMEGSSMSGSQNSDVIVENQLLSKEIDGLRERVKSLQQTVESLTSRNIQLIVDRDATPIPQTHKGDASEESRNIIESYVKEMEELRAKFMESEKSLQVMKQSRNSQRFQTSQSELRNYNVSPDEHVKGVLSVAQTDLNSLRNKFKMRSSSLEGDKVTTDDNETEDVELTEEELSDCETSSQSALNSDLNENLADLTCEISIKEKLIEELRMTQMRIRTMRIQYEEKMKTLEAKIKETQLERDRVIANLESAESNSEGKSQKVKDDYEKKLSELQTELKKLDQANHEHSRLLKNHATIEKQYKTLQQDLLEMKKLKVQMMNKIKEDAQKSRQIELLRSKEINQLKKEQRAKENQIKNLEADKKQKEIILKRRQEEVESLRKRNRPVMSAKVMGQVVRNDGTVSQDSTRPKRPSKFSKSSKILWNDIEKSIISIVSKKKTLGCLERDMNRWLKQRNHLRKKLETLRMRKNESLNLDDTLESIESIEGSITYIQENILSCQNNIVEMEEGKDEDSDPLRLLTSCSLTQYKYIVEHAINSLITKGLIVVEKEAEIKELSAKLHQQKMDGTFQRDVIQFLIQDKENIDIDDSLLSQIRDSDEDEEEDDDDGIVSKIKDEHIISSSTPCRWAERPPVPPFIPKEDLTLGLQNKADDPSTTSLPTCGRKDKARRKTATPEELLFVGRSSSVFETIIENETSDETSVHTDRLKDTSNPSNTKNGSTVPPPRVIPRLSGSKLPTNVLLRHNDNLNNNKKMNNKQLLGPDSSPVFKKKPLSASSSLGSDSLSKMGSLGSTNTDTNTPPTSPGSNRRNNHTNVFSRLYSRTQPISPHPAKGVIRSSTSHKASQNFPLTHCYSALGHTKAVLSVFATDDFLFSSSKDRTAKMWDLQTGEELLTLGVHLNNVVSVKYAECKGIVYTSSTYLVKLWDPRIGGSCIKSLTSAGFVCEGTNCTSGQVTRQLTCPPGETNIVDMCVSSSGNSLYVAVGNIVRVWDMRMYKAVGKLSGGHQAAIMALAIDDTDTADGNICIVTGSKDHYIKVYEVMEDMIGSLCPRYNLEPPHYDGIQSLCLKGDFLFSGSRDMCIKKWDLAAQQLKQSINNAHKDWICGLTFLPSANCVLSACRAGVMKIWNVDNCNLVGEIHAHSSPINAISSNSHMIFSASNDKSIQFWKCKDDQGLTDTMDDF